MGHDVGMKIRRRGYTLWAQNWTAQTVHILS